MGSAIEQGRVGEERKAPQREVAPLLRDREADIADLVTAAGESVMKCPSPLNVLKDTYDHSCY